MDKIVLGMGLTRLLFGLMNVVGAAIVFKANTVESGFRVNAVLAAVGPFVPIVVVAVGLAGAAGKIPPLKLAAIVVGTFLTIWGTLR